ncbi:MAG: hypothetical protein WDO19_09230 [Bacteroidota bacterium]
MTRKNNYAALDDIGFVGVDDKRSKAQRDEDAKRTSEYIRKYLSKKNNNKVAIGKVRIKNGSSSKTKIAENTPAIANKKAAIAVVYNKSK